MKATKAPSDRIDRILAKCVVLIPKFCNKLRRSTLSFREESKLQRSPESFRESPAFNLLLSD